MTITYYVCDPVTSQCEELVLLPRKEAKASDDGWVTFQKDYIQY